MSITLPNFGILQITGARTSEFLQGQLTCDVNKLAANVAQLSAHLNPQGRIISLFYLCQYENGFYAIMPRHLIPIAQQALLKYAVFYRASLLDISSAVALFITPIANKVTAYQLLPQDLQLQLHIVPAGENFALANQALTEPQWQRRMLAQHIPTIYPETSALFLPHELNLPTLGAVSFDKGCYTGQEIVARMHYKAKMKKVLTNYAFTNPAKPGSHVFANKKRAGTVLTTVSDNELTYLSLVLLDNADFLHQSLSLENNI